MQHTNSDVPIMPSKPVSFKTKTISRLFTSLWKHFPAFTKTIVKKAVFSPTAYKTSKMEKRVLKQGQSFKMPLREKKIKCWKWGDGPAILLAHGWNGRGIQLHAFIRPLVHAGYSAIAFDAPGHGRSPGRYSSYFEYSDLIRTFFGAYPDMMIKGVIAHSLGASAVINGLHKEDSNLATVLIAPPLNLIEILHRMFVHVGFPLQILHELIIDFEKQFGYQLIIDNPIELLPQIKSNLLIVHDKQDKAIPYIDSYDAGQKYPTVQLHTTIGLGHKRILFDGPTSDFIIDYLRQSIRVEKFSRNSMTLDRQFNDQTMKMAKEQYKAGDFETRLHLFLDNPKLRKGFIDIELNRR